MMLRAGGGGGGSELNVAMTLSVHIISLEMPPNGMYIKSITLVKVKHS